MSGVWPGDQGVRHSTDPHQVMIMIVMIVMTVMMTIVREASLEAVTALCDSLDWRAGLGAVARCQALHDRCMVPPSIELYNTQISIWRALWMIVGNKKIKKGII